MKTKLLILIFLVLVTPVVNAQPLLTLDDIFVNGTYNLKRFGPIRWMEGGRFYTTIEYSSAADHNEIIRYETVTGSREVLVSARDLTPTGAAKPLQIQDYIWSPGGDRLMIFTNTRRVWRHHTRGDYWLLDLKSRKLTQLGRIVEPATMMFAKFSPDGKRWPMSAC